MVYRISSMYTHDRKILRILVTAFMTEFLSAVVIQMVEWLHGSNVKTAGEFFIMYSL